MIDFSKAAPQIIELNLTKAGDSVDQEKILVRSLKKIMKKFPSNLLYAVMEKEMAYGQWHSELPGGLNQVFWDRNYNELFEWVRVCTEPVIAILDRNHMNLIDGSDLFQIKSHLALHAIINIDFGAPDYTAVIT